MKTDIHGILQACNSAGDWQDVLSDYCHDRNRDNAFFAWLADVTNGEPYDVEPISVPRGLPADFVMLESLHPIAANAFRGPAADEFAKRDSDGNYGGCLQHWMGNSSHSLGRR